MEALEVSQGLHFIEFVPADGAVCALLLQCGIQDRSVYINLALILIHILCLIYGTKRS
jgi:phospholipid N-methyltransferase